jgi:hypothetical protein
MGEYAEIQWRLDASRGMRARPRTGPKARNPISGTCPVCGKGIRAIAGCVGDSLKQHMRAKHRGVEISDAMGQA